MTLMSAHVLYGFAAATIAVVAETAYRSVQGPWHQYLWAWIPMQTAMSYCIYRLVTEPNLSLLDAFVTFTFCTILLRVAVSLFILEDDIHTGTWVALGLIVLAKLAQAYWVR